MLSNLSVNTYASQSSLNNHASLNNVSLNNASLNAANNAANKSNTNIAAKKPKKSRSSSIVSDIAGMKSPTKEFVKTNAKVNPSLVINKSKTDIIKEFNLDNIPSLLKKRDANLIKLNSLDGINNYERANPGSVVPRVKCHWDYVLDEVMWMAVDYRQELRLVL
jgi:hypothetical protein